MCNFNIGHNCSPIADSNFIFGMCIHLIKANILMGDMLRPMSSFKVKGQIEVQSGKGDIAVSRTHLVIKSN